MLFAIALIYYSDYTNLVFQISTTMAKNTLMTQL